MKFIDTAKLKLTAGRGGDGCISFRREKYVPRGGPNGGNGGLGASIYFIGDKTRHTLMDFRYKIIYKAPAGENGRGNDQHGKGGEDLILPVPLGTIIKNAATGEIIADIVNEGVPYLAAKGGKGGRGNLCFATPEQRTPRIAEDGIEGDELEVALELKLIADIGIVGFPNAGKSTFISVVSAAKPKIADYPFTTLEPNLGVVNFGAGSSFVLADMPGLIENAHLGVGLGQQFLRHIERTRGLLHFVDSSEDSSMVDRYEIIRRELTLYEAAIGDKPQIVAATKIDSVIDDHYQEFLRYAAENKIKVYPISSAAHTGVDELMKVIEQLLKASRKNETSA